ncbi:MAG: ABC transporter permease [Sedimentisphaerales bacterium]|nr:ABC transporter permease [Sedimentisphaerales bacterium]
MPPSNARLYPPLWRRLYSVWFRHMRVYTRHLISNGFPPFLEPLIFLGGIGLGLGDYIGKMDNMPYLEYLATGLLCTAAMWTAAFECSYGTFIRLEFEKVYDGMLAAPITAENLIVGEILWAGTKGVFFSFAVLCVLSLFGILRLPNALIAPFVGFLTGTMFGALSLLITSYVKTINHFNFYMTGLLSPMFFFSGVVFPISKLPPAVYPFAQLLPLTHSVRLLRAVYLVEFDLLLFWNAAYIVIFITLIGFFAVKRLKKRLIN